MLRQGFDAAGRAQDTDISYLGAITLRRYFELAFGAGNGREQ
jgi:hypothetical protein